MKERFYSVVCVFVVLSMLLTSCGPDAPAQKAGHLPYLALETSADANGGIVQGVKDKETGDRGVIISSMSSTSGTVDVWFASRREASDRKEFGIPKSHLKQDGLNGIVTDAVLMRHRVPETQDSRTILKVGSGVLLGISLAIATDWGIGKLTATGGKVVAKEAAEEGLERVARMNVDDVAEFAARYSLSAGDNLTDDALEELLQLGHITDEQADLFRQGALKTDDLDDVLRSGGRGVTALVETARTGDFPLQAVYNEGRRLSFYHVDDLRGLQPGLGALYGRGPTYVIETGETFMHFRFGPIEFTKATRSGGVTTVGGEIHALLFPVGSADDVAQFAARQVKHADEGLSHLPAITRLAAEGLGEVPVEFVGNRMVTNFPVSEIIRPVAGAGVFVPAP